MTNKEDADGGQVCDPRLAAYLAVHVVKEILDDACVIANSAIESGQTWHYQSMVENDKLRDTDGQDVTFEAESDVVNENKSELVANIVATSTPQKVTVGVLRSNMEASFIGQGDEENKLRRNELTKSTSMIIDRIFHISEFDNAILCNDTENIQSNSESNELLTQAMSTIIDSYIKTALDVVLEHPAQLADTCVPMENSSSSGNSEYSLLSDAFNLDIKNNAALYIYNADEAIECEVFHSVPAMQITEINDEIADECIKNVDVARFEKAYLSLNRDYEQCSEDDGNVILKDLKGMTLQEVELLTANSSNQDLSHRNQTESEAKSVKRRVGTIHGLCPLSPDGRRRAASLVDQRLLRSPSPSRGGWKFNTINEALVQSSHWKDYSFDASTERM